MKPILNFTVLLMSLIVLTACTSMPMASMWKMSKIKPLEIDPKSVSIAVLTHKTVTFGKDAVKIQLAYKTALVEQSDDETFMAQVSHDISTLNEADRKQLSSYQRPDERISIFSLTEENAKSMKTLQQKIRTLKRNNVDGKGSLSVGIVDVCLSDANVGKLMTNIFAKFNEKDGYILLTKNIDLLETLKQGGASKEKWICK